MVYVSVWERKEASDAFFLQSQQTMLRAGANVLSTSKSTAVFDPLNPNDAKPAPPNVGVPQQCTTILIRKLNGVYTLLADGVEIQPDESGEYWLPRFCDVPATTETPRTVGPLCVGLRVEEGETAPEFAAVNVQQSIVDGGTVLLKSADVLQRPDDLDAHRPNDLICGFTLLPYPATIIRPPTVTIIDMTERRRWEFKRRKWNNSRTWDVIQAVGSTVGLLAAASASSGSLTQAARQWFTEGLGTAASTLWKLAAYKASPTLANLVSTSWAVLSFPMKQFSATEPPPTRLKTYQFTMTQLISALEKMANTDKSTGGVNGFPTQLSPHQFAQAGYKPEAALLEYLLFGNQSALDATNSGLADAEEDKEGNKSLWSTMKNPFPEFLRWNTKSLTGNLLNPSSLSLPICMQTRVEYSVQLVITDPTLPNGSIVFKLRPLQHNAVDAGLIYSGIEAQHKRLDEARKRVVAKLVTLKNVGMATSWMHSRLYVSTQPSSSIFGLDTVKSIVEEATRLASLSTSADEETRRRWESLDTSNKSSPTALPIVFSANEFKRRLNRILYGQAVNEDDSGVVSTSYYEGGIALSERRRSNVVGLGGGVLASGITTDQYETMLGKRLDLYRNTVGASQATSVQQSRAFWRYVDAYIPLGTIDDFRLASFIVPEIGSVKASPQLIQRFPQVGISSSRRLSVFGNVSLLPVKPVPDRTISKRQNAKLAVDTTRRCWNEAATTYSLLNWTVESKSVHGFSNAFHFHILYEMEEESVAVRALGELRYQPVRSLKPNTLVLTGCQPAQVSQLETLYLQSNPTDRFDTLDEELRGDALLLRQLKLDEIRVNMKAVHVHAAISSERAFGIANGDPSKLETSIYTTQVSEIIEQLFGSSTKVRTLVSERDILFACFPAAREAIRALFNVPAWREAQTTLEAVPVVRNSALLPLVNLNQEEKNRITIFARSLYKLSTSTNTKTMSQLPVTPYQSMWFTANPSIHRLQLYDERYRGKSGVQIQYEEASHSLKRVQDMTSNVETSAIALACVEANRPVLKLAPKIEFRYNEVLTRLSPTVTHSAFNRSMTLKVRTHLRYRAACLRIRSEDVLTSVMAAFSRVDLSDSTSETHTVDPHGLKFRVPVGCPFAETGNGLTHALSYTSSLEDLPVPPSLVLQTLPLMFTNCVDCKITATPVAQNGQKGGKGRIMHPHDIELKQNSNPQRQHWYLYLSALRDQELASLNTWTLHDPVCSLMFNVDRISQMLVLAEVEDDDVGFIVLDATNTHFDTVGKISLLCIASALGESTASAQIGCTLRHSVRVKHALSKEGDMRALNSNIEIFKEMMVALDGRPASLSEVCLSAACGVFS